MVRSVSQLRAWTLDAAGDREGAAAQFRVAVAELQEQLAEAPEDDRIMGALALALSGSGDHAAGIQLAEQAVALVPPQVDSQLGPWNIANLALVLAAAGEADRAVSALRDVYAHPYGDPPLAFAADPRFDGIREHPAFQAFVREHGG